MYLLSDELHLAWKRHMEAGFPYQIDLPYEISRATLASTVEFCEPHDVWSASVYRQDGLECMRAGFKDARAARNFRRKFRGEAVECQTKH